jgi:SMI1 / KNR4 family (SUKH-1)
MKDSFDDIKLILLNAPLSPDDKEPSGASDAELRDAELDLSIQLPSCLKEWLRVVNSCCVGGGGLLGINAKLECNNLKTVFELYPHWKANRWFPVAADGSGNYYVLFSDGERNPVAFIDVTEDSWELTYVVASSLAIFLRAFIGKESGEKGWPFCEQVVLEMDPQLVDVKSAPMPWE